MFRQEKTATPPDGGVYVTALTVLTRLTALTADRIDHVDIVDGLDPMRSSPNEVNLVNNVRCQYRQCRQYGQSRPNSLASAAGESDPEELIGSTMLFDDYVLNLERYQWEA